VRNLRVALAQVNPTVGDLEGNTRKVLEYLDHARSFQADLVAFPELVLTGYPPEDLLLNTALIRDNQTMLKKIVSSSQDIGLIIGYVDAQDHELYNAAAIVWNGEQVGVYHKIFLPNYGVFDEERYFKAGTTCPVYVIQGTGVGVNICEDIWHAVGPIPVQRDAGAEVIININGSPYQSGKAQSRELMLSTRAKDNDLFIAYVNTVGGQDELVFDGASTIFDHDGGLVARGMQFKEDLIVADLDMESVFRQHLHAPITRKETPSTFFQLGNSTKTLVTPLNHERPRSPLIPKQVKLLDTMGEIYEALVLGTKDYVQKNQFNTVLVSVSGGIDSSLTCCIAVDALGSDCVHTVAMPSRYSSEASLTDAQELARNLGISLWVLPIEPAHRAFEEVLEPLFRGTDPNIAEQNIQARIRGNLLMALSNKHGWLVLNTGNKSEMSMGYATLYGDMAGGFAVLKDVPKTLVYELSLWRNEHGKEKMVIPEGVIAKPPSAELKPDQKDEDDLPPYHLLDRLLHAYVEEDRSYEEILRMGFDQDIVQRVIRSVDLNEYKRRQSPTGIKITPRAFGRDRRMPIVNNYRSF